VIAIDTNLLVYAHRPDNPWHEKASGLLRMLAEEPSLWAIPWPCVHEFLGVVTNPRTFLHPTPPEVALRQVELWQGSPSLVLLAEQAGYWPRLSAVMAKGGVIGPRVHDARIAALCLHHGVRELWSADRDFSRFPDLKARNPLIG
jgi:toxin-antitoxin system PIN domain toxin